MEKFKLPIDSWVMQVITVPTPTPLKREFVCFCFHRRLRQRWLLPLLLPPLLLLVFSEGGAISLLTSQHTTAIHSQPVINDNVTPKQNTVWLPCGHSTAAWRRKKREINCHIRCEAVVGGRKKREWKHCEHVTSLKPFTNVFCCCCMSSLNVFLPRQSSCATNLFAYCR